MPRVSGRLHIIHFRMEDNHKLPYFAHLNSRFKRFSVSRSCIGKRVIVQITFVSETKLLVLCLLSSTETLTML